MLHGDGMARAWNLPPLKNSLVSDAPSCERYSQSLSDEFPLRDVSPNLVVHSKLTKALFKFGLRDA